jgi:tight adherence protein C
VSGLARSGAVLGFVLGLGLALVWLGLPRHRRPGLAGRVLPYLRDTPRPSRLLDEGRPALGARGALGVVAGPVLRDLGGVVERVMGGAESVRRRQLRAGMAADVDRFRAEQVLWGALGAVVGTAFGVLALALRDAGAVTVLMCAAIGLGLGVTGADYLLSRRAARREARMLTEFPTVAELLALAVSAGEGAVGALDRVCRLSHGELAGELRRCLADARAGANLPTALQGLADRTGLASLRRFVDGVVIAVQRGTPLADVLRAQAQDVREEGRRALMEAGGRKEIAMMVPVVFLILPVTVLFAVFPGFTFFRFTL